MLVDPTPLRLCHKCWKPLRPGIKNDPVIFQWHERCLKVVKNTRTARVYQMPQGGFIRIGKSR